MNAYKNMGSYTEYKNQELLENVVSFPEPLSPTVPGNDKIFKVFNPTANSAETQLNSGVLFSANKPLHLLFMLPLNGQEAHNSAAQTDKSIIMRILFSSKPFDTTAGKIPEYITIMDYLFGDIGTTKDCLSLASPSCKKAKDQTYNILTFDSTTKTIAGKLLCKSASTQYYCYNFDGASNYVKTSFAINNLNPVEGFGENALFPSDTILDFYGCVKNSVVVGDYDEGAFVTNIMFLTNSYFITTV